MTRILLLALALLSLSRARAAQHVLQLAQHGLVPGHGGRLRESDGHQGRGRSEGDRRNARADQGRARESEGRHLVGRGGRQLPAGRGGRPARALPLAQRVAALRLGAAHHRHLEEPHRRRVRRHPGARLQHRDRRQEEAARAEMLEGPHQSRAQGRGDARQSQLVGNSVPHARLARADHGRGRSVPLHGGGQPERDELRALGHRPHDGGYARRSLRRQHRAARRHQRDRARLPRPADPPLRGRRLRSRLDGDRQGIAQPRRGEEVLRLGAHRPKRRRSASTSRNSRFRPIAAFPCHRKCRSSPTSR